ncbi:MAG: hypothetical protein IT521_00480 [Burkholderiales bacterium]|nr:hypothetical protein [Burkholderiales bacterium]
MATPDDLQTDAARVPAAGARRFLSRRTLWHTVGLLLAAALAWLILRAYRQPEFMLDLVNLRLC